MNLKKVIILICFFNCSQVFGAKVKSIEFSEGEKTNSISIISDEPVQYVTKEDSEKNQLVLELDNADLGPNASRSLNTSSFDSPVLLISPYQDKKNNKARIVIQFKSNVLSTVTQDGSQLKVQIPRTTVSASDEDLDNLDDLDSADADPFDDTEVTASSESDKAPEDIFDEQKEGLLDTGLIKDFKGKPITLRARDADVRDVLRLIGEASGFNIIIGPQVKGSMTLSLDQVPWDQALEVVLNTMRLGAERNKNVLRVLTLSNLTREKKEQQEAKLASMANAPKITKMFPINYANPAELQTILTAFGRNSDDPGGSGASNVQDKVQIDARTNSLIIQDIPENVEQMAKLIDLLDAQTPQVLVEAKVVEATEQFTRGIGGSIGISGVNDNPSAGTQWISSFVGANPIDSLVGGIFAAGSDVVTQAGGNSLFGISPRLGFLGGNTRLNAILTVGEQESTVKVISSPRMVVLSKSQENIVAGTPVEVKTTSFSAQAGASIPLEEIRTANLTLDVTPTVTNDQSVLMNLMIERSLPSSTPSGSSAIANRTLNTNVIVQSGSTLVIGGIYQSSKSESSSGMPFLKDIPLLGWLFGSETETNERTELFIFVTPKILNTKASGLTG